MDILIYNQEIKDGVGDLIKANASIAYTVQPKLVTPDEETINRIKATSNTILEVQRDLYYLDCILASVGWNANEDVFPALDTFNARATPINKPFNYMHTENDIIGHMVASRVLAEDGSIITTNNVDELPTKFDIGTTSVLYKIWSDKKLQTRMDDIIDGIAKGKWFVSMECLFPSFDYAIITPEGENKVIARNEQSAFLSKHLRAYGGSGEFNGNKVGRLLRNFAFSGKGLVDNPANKRSIIFNTQAFNGTSASVKILTKGRNMESELLKTQLDEAKAALKAATDENKQLQAKAREEADKAVAEKVAKLEAELEQLRKVDANKQNDIDAKAAQVAELTASLAEKDTKVAELTKSIETMKTEAVNAARLTKLATAGISGEEADKLIAKFASASEEIFDEFVALKAEMSKDMKSNKDKSKEEKAKCSTDTDIEVDKAGEATATTTDVTTLEENKEATLTSAADKTNDMRAGAMAFIKANVLKTTANAGK